MVDWDALEREVYENAKYTSSTCKDSGRLVISRKAVANILTRELGELVTVMALNQMVSKISLQQKRRAYTVQSASRSKYLLVEGGAAMSVLEWVINNPGEVEVADKLAEEASLIGSKYKRGLLKAKRK